MRKNFLVFGSPQIQQAEIDEVVKVMNSAWLGTGPYVQKFQEQFAAYIGAPYASALSSATAGLHLACLTCDLQPGDEVITTAMTFCATVNAIIHAGGTPVIADIDPKTWNIDPAQIKKKITSRTKAIVPVHFAGRACDMTEIMKIAKEHKLTVIEDCAHAIETSIDGKHVGTFGEFGVFSFYATKNLATGEGGMVLTKSESLNARIKMLSLHGMSKDAWKRFSDEGYKHYYVEAAGFKYNMMDLQAAIGIHQLERISENHKRREQIWARYMEEFAGSAIGLPSELEQGNVHAYHLFNITVNKEQCGVSRDQFLNQMTACKIGVGVHYLSIPEHPFYRKTFGWDPAKYPVAAKFGQETVSLPLTAKLTDDDVSDVIEAVKSILS